ALVDPEKEETKKIVEDLKNQGYQLNLNLCSEESFKKAINLYKEHEYKEEIKVETKVDVAKLETYEKEIKNLTKLGEKLRDMPVAEVLNLINLGAVKVGASDAHLHPTENGAELRFRIDGVLQKIFEIDSDVFGQLATQIKHDAKLKINVGNIPQDGEYNFLFNERKIDVRVSTLPTEFGESFVMRFLDPEEVLLEFEQLGFEGGNLKKIQKATRLPYGLVLATGPTGSGKTTTLYTILRKLDTPENKIVTLEDPIEYHLPEIAQSEVDEADDYSFSMGLKAILRQDPDIIMIGEIRDTESAEAATQAALTGHVVLSTLHTNNVVEALPRLVNMGVKPFVLAPAITLIIAQRLVRKVCDKCGEKKKITTSEKEEIAKILEEIKKVDSSIKAEVPAELPQAKGCDECSHTGYKGRICISEVLEVDEEMRELILKEASEKEFFAKAREKGFTTMKEDGILKVIAGVTTLLEVYRVEGE
ncbi:MAG TPA: type II/IV secretion system protein, partial [Candidatus Peregrinibacteria bacterium]|nr:type II/IV secretion system protein [Candidatus Peregrinibacteria bacterium]